MSTTNNVCSNNVQNLHSRFSHQWRPGLCAGSVLTTSRRGLSGSVSASNTPSKSLAQTRLSTRSISSVQSRKPRFCCGRFQSRFQILHWLLPSQCRSVRVGISTPDPQSLWKTWTVMGHIDNQNGSHFHTQTNITPAGVGFPAELRFLRYGLSRVTFASAGPSCLTWTRNSHTSIIYRF